MTNLDTPLIPAIYSKLDRQLRITMRDTLFSPLVAILKKSTAQQLRFENTAGDDALRVALRTGRVQYTQGVFSGRFSAAISGALRALGAKIDKRRAVYVLDTKRVPAWALAEAAAFQVGARETNAALRKQLDTIGAKLDAAVDSVSLQEAADGTVTAVEGAFRHVARELEMPPDMSANVRRQMQVRYLDNVKLSVKDFSADMVQRLRKVVEKNAMEGYRADRLIGALEARYDITLNRAAFIAREETRLFMSTYRSSRFQERGIISYVWSTSHDARVRDDHKALNGKVFQYASPPIVNRATGRTGNPGQDYGCRCIDKPIIASIADFR